MMDAAEFGKWHAARRPPAASPVVVLDMDGTVLDRHFDDHFWEEFLPREYGRKNAIPFDAARTRLLAMYREREGTLDWTDLDYWSERLGLDIADLKRRQGHMIAYLPGARDFLARCRERGVRLLLATDAHPRTLEIKEERCGLTRYFEKTVCAAEVGYPKRDPGFWQGFFRLTGVRPEECLLADDSPRALAAARAAGIGLAVEIARPSSRGRHRTSGRFPAVAGIAGLESLPAWTKAAAPLPVANHEPATSDP